MITATATSRRHFFDHRIAPEQIAAAKKTRELVSKKVGSYSEVRFAGQQPDKSRPETVKRARNLASFAVQLQWVTGDAGKAEASFFTINQEAVPINPTELRMLKSRKKPNAVAARAILRAGGGHKFWSDFPEENQAAIEKLAREIYEMLFAPPLKTPIKTLDLPVAGRAYSAQSLPLIFDLVNLANAAETDGTELADDTDGSQTTAYLKEVRRITWRICGNHASSLGLHPAVYVYSATGRHQPTSLLAVAALMMDFEKHDYFSEFTKNRKQFEQFLIKHKSFTNQVVRKIGSALKGYPHLFKMYSLVLERIDNGDSEEKTIELLQADKGFSYLKPDEMPEPAKGGDFSSETKSATFLREALQGAITCQICGGLMHPNSTSFDHKTRKAEGGLGTMDNAQLAHFFCNTTYKN